MCCGRRVFLSSAAGNPRPAPGKCQPARGGRLAGDVSGVAGRNGRKASYGRAGAGREDERHQRQPSAQAGSEAAKHNRLASHAASNERGEGHGDDSMRPRLPKSARRQTAENTAAIEISRTARSEDAEPEMPENFRTAPLAAGKVQWDHSQATGAPDTDSAGDKPTAWAPLQPGSGEQWLQLGYDTAVEVREVNIHETYNPGAISKVAALMPDGSEKVLWQGTAERAPSGEVLETSLPVPPGITASQIKIYVDTNRVQSWPEIDAVELVGVNGSRQWATSSQASSSYSENYTGQPVVSQ